MPVHACLLASRYVVAALADTPSIKSIRGGPTIATLSFLKPESATDQDTITYSAQVCRLLRPEAPCLASLPS